MDVDAILGNGALGLYIGVRRYVFDFLLCVQRRGSRSIVRRSWVYVPVDFLWSCLRRHS